MLFTLYKKKPFGLDISDHSIEALSLRKKWGKLTLGAYNRIVIPAGIINNGIIVKPNELAPYLLKINKQSSGDSFGINQCLITLPQSQTYGYLVELQADLPPPQLKTAVQEKIESIIPIPLEDLVYHYVKVGKTDDESKEKIFIVAVAKDTFNVYLKALKEANLEVLAADVEFLSNGRSLLRGYSFRDESAIKGEKQAVMLIDSGYNATNFSFFQEEGPQYISESKIAGNKIVEIIMEKLSLSREEAEAEKELVGVTKIVQSKQFQQIINQLVVEIKDSIDHFQQNFKNKVAEIILTGGNSLIAGLPTFLSQALNISVKCGDPFFGIAKDQKVLNRDAVLYSNVVGLALRGFYWGEQMEENNVNFLENI